MPDNSSERARAASEILAAMKLLGGAFGNYADELAPALAALYRRIAELEAHRKEEKP